MSRESVSAISAVSALIVVATVVLSAQPSDRERAEALARRAADRMLALQREADSLANQEHTLLGDLRKLEIEREIKTAELKQADAAVSRAQAELDATAARMTTLESQAAAERPELRARLVELYKLGQARYLRLLFSTADLRRIGQATRTVAALGKIDRDRVAAHQRTLADLKATRSTLEQSVREAAASRATAVKAAGRGTARRAGAQRPDSGHRSPARPERAARGRVALGATETPGLAPRPRLRQRPGEHRLAAAPAVPRRPGLAVRRCRPATLRPPTGGERNRDRGDRRRERPGHPRGRGRIRRHLRRFRQPRHPRAQPADLQSLRRFTGSRRLQRIAAGTRANARNGRRHSGRTSRAVFRTPRRRSAGRSFTMAAEALID